MFSKLAILFAVTMTAFVAAGGNSGINNSCESGSVQCCNSLYKSDTAEWSLVQELVDVNLLVDTMVGAHCSPLTLVGVGSGSQCSSQPVCCDKSDSNSLISFNCSPIDVL